jgi:drug/metabolite transporter (DMT)-like permease
MIAPEQGARRTELMSGPLMVAIGALAIGYAPIGLRLSEFGPQATAFWRYAFALPLLVLLAIRFGGLRGPSWAAVCAGVFFGLDMVLWHASLTLTSVANATFIVNLGSILAGVVAWAVLKQPPTRTWPAAAVLAFVGAWMLSRGAAAPAASAPDGDLLALGAAGFVAGYIVASAIARRRDEAMSVMVWTTLSSLAVALAAVLGSGERLLPPKADWLLVPASLGLVAHVLGQGLIVAGLGRTPPSVAGLLILIQPVASAAIAWRAFGEPMTALQVGGCGLILAGIWLAGRRTSAPKPEPPAGH